MHLWEVIGLRGCGVVGGSRNLAARHPQPTTALPIALVCLPECIS